jgi:hypothetical protein
MRVQESRAYREHEGVKGLKRKGYERVPESTERVQNMRVRRNKRGERARAQPREGINAWRAQGYRIE